MKLRVFEGVKLIYKDIESDLISKDTNSKDAYKFTLEFKEHVDIFKI